jgi:hypothetical protein
MSLLTLKRGKLSRSSGQWQDEDYDGAENRSVGCEETKAHIQGVSTEAAVGLNMCPTSLPSLVTS